MNRFIFKKVIAMACFVVVMLTLTACGGNQASTTPAINEPAVTATPSPTPTQNAPATGQVNEPATSDPEEAGGQGNQSVLTVEQAQNLVQEAFAGYEIINHNAEYDFMEGDVLHLFFEVSYSAFSGITDVVWVDTITGALETISGVEFLHGDDWFEDYDPYWMYRDGGLDPFGDDDWGDTGTVAGGGYGGDIRLVGIWELPYVLYTLQFHQNGMYELRDAEGNLLDQGSWNTGTNWLGDETLNFWNKVNLDDPNSVWQQYQGTPPGGTGGLMGAAGGRRWDVITGQYRILDDNRARIHDPRREPTGTWGREWTRIQ